MNRTIALKLSAAVKILQERMSNTERPNNYNDEVFTNPEITPLSENTAAVIFTKSSGKKALFFFFYASHGEGHWFNTAITDGHLLGMQKITDYYYDVEKHNYKYNFQEERT